MDDLKIIVYVIAAIIWMVARNYKKVQQTRPKIETRTEGSPVETIRPVSAPVVQRTPMEEKTPYQKMVRESVHDSYKSERLKSVVAKPKIERPKPKTAFRISQVLQTNEQNYVINTETELVKEKNPFFEFDLRKAVIYSEILKRPAY